MAKKRAIVSYDRLTTEQKKEINKAFPEGYGTNMTQIITPNGETLDALIWETEEIIYLVKIIRNSTSTFEDEDEEDEEDDLDDLIKPDDLDEEDEDEDEAPKKKSSKNTSYDDDEEGEDDIAEEDEEEEDED